jgi:post-segregation antitoxin (ccd killing protein)
MRMTKAHSRAANRRRPAAKRRQSRLRPIQADDAIVEFASELRLYLLKAVERYLGPRGIERRSKRWRRENRAAIESMNQFVREHGLWCLDKGENTEA